MTNRVKIRFLKIVVTTCIITIIIFGIATHVATWFHIDTVPTYSLICGVFGGNLVITALIQLIGDKVKTPEKPKE